MSKQDSAARDDATTTADDVAIGVVATVANTDTVVRTILRSSERGHGVFVGHYGDETIEAVRFAEQLDATVINPIDSDPDREEIEQELMAVARADGYEGVVMQSADGERIDFERSVDALEESDYNVRSIPEGSLSTSLNNYVLVGIPACNEENTIDDVITEAINYGSEVLVVEDGSDDDTAKQATNAGATIVSHASNRGYGAALQTLFTEAHRRRVDTLVVIDGDGQHETADIPRLVEHQHKTGSQIIVGSRFVGENTESVPLLRHVGLFIINTLTNLSLGIVRPRNWIRDTQSGFRVYSREAVTSLATDAMISDRMGASTDILYHAHAQGYDIEEVGTRVYYDVEDGSTHDPLSHGIVLLHNIVRTVESRRPMTVLGIPGVALSLLGSGFAYWTIINYLNSGSFGYGLAITSTFFVLAGIFSVFTAIILHSLNRRLEPD